MGFQSVPVMYLASQCSLDLDRPQKHSKRMQQEEHHVSKHRHIIQIYVRYILFCISMHTYVQVYIVYIVIYTYIYIYICIGHIC